ncbi:MAG: hypothetical protein BAJALOKI1v1_140009 [Promethearchaeota archaeon]|nr:MAG: hypothetical protein BAJALOKI1v1_140009 [Candidatus Lokiarchaeota archaeon]
MSLMIYTVSGKDIIPVDNTDLNEEKIYIILDTHAKRPKIWIWSGSNSSMIDRYHAGVSATKIKSRKKLYGASIEVVESGAEPEQFPNLSEAQLLEATEETFEEEAPKFIPEHVVEAETETKSGLEPGLPSQEPAMTPEIMVQEDNELKEQFKSFLLDISMHLSELKDKIDDFIKNF